MDGSPARWIALIHQFHVAGEEGGTATMVAVFLPVLPVGVVLCLSSHDVTRSSYVAVGTKKLKEGPAWGLGMLRYGPPWPAPHPVQPSEIVTVDGNSPRLPPRRPSPEPPIGRKVSAAKHGHS